MVRRRSPKPLIKVRFLAPLPYHKLTLIRGLFYCPVNGVEYEMLKDAGNQSIFWSGFGAFWAMYSFQEWLAIFGLIIGLISGLVNMYAKCQEGKVRENEERRAEEMHKARMKRLEQGLDNGTKED